MKICLAYLGTLTYRANIGPSQEGEYGKPVTRIIRQSGTAPAAVIGKGLTYATNRLILLAIGKASEPISHKSEDLPMTSPARAGGTDRCAWNSGP